MPAFATVFSLALLLACAAAAAQGPDLLKYELKRLDTVATEDLERFRGTPVLMMFFEPECAWCLRQAREIERLTNHCTGVQPLVVGANGSRTALQAWLRRMAVDVPAYQISKRLSDDLGGVATTPITLVADASGTYRRYLRGYKKLDALLAALPADSCT